MRNRLYSSAHFNDNFPQHSDPEVLRTPLEGVALVMKAMGIDKVRSALSLYFLHLLCLSAASNFLSACKMEAF